MQRREKISEEEKEQLLEKGGRMRWAPRGNGAWRGSFRTLSRARVVKRGLKRTMRPSYKLATRRIWMTSTNRELQTIEKDSEEKIKDELTSLTRSPRRGRRRLLPELALAEDNVALDDAQQSAIPMQSAQPQCVGARRAPQHTAIKHLT